MWFNWWLRLSWILICLSWLWWGLYLDEISQEKQVATKEPTSLGLSNSRRRVWPALAKKKVGDRLLEGKIQWLFNPPSFQPLRQDLEVHFPISSVAAASVDRRAGQHWRCSSPRPHRDQTGAKQQVSSVYIPQSKELAGTDANAACLARKQRLVIHG